MAKIDIKGLIPGKKYRMVIEANTDSYTVDNLPSIEFVVPKAPTHAKNYKLKVQQGTYDYKKDATSKVVKKPKLTLTIPSEVYDDLIWKDDVRDIVYILYRTAANKKIALRQNRKTLATGFLMAQSDISVPYFTPTKIEVSGTSPKTVTITVPSHYLLADNYIYIDGITNSGISALNGTKQKITAITSTTVTFTTTASITNSVGPTHYATGLGTLGEWSIYRPLWLTSHPKSYTIKVKDTNYYSFEFVIARYVKDSYGNWSNGVWLQGTPGAGFKNIISKETPWGK